MTKDNLQLLKQLMTDFPKSFSQKIRSKSYKFLLDDIIASTPLLTNKHMLMTRIYWVLNGLEDFPRCRVCGEKLVTQNVINIKEGYNKTCSKNCSYKDIQRNAKIKETLKTLPSERRKEIDEKTQQTCLERYGTRFSFQSENNKTKSQQTCMKKYGAKTHMQSKKYVEQYKQKLQEKYGVTNVFQRKEVKEKIRQTLLSKYGVDHPSKIDESICPIHENSKITKRKHSYEELLKNELDEPLFDEQFFVENFYKGIRLNFKCRKCGKSFSATYADGYHHPCPKCFPNTKSLAENELFEFISQFAPDAYQTDRTLIAPYELDIVIPSKMLAIEFDGIYWHSSQNPKNRNKTYHLTKTQLCSKAGYQLVHIFEDEWILRKDIVKSRLKTMLGKYDSRIYARQCSITEVTAADAKVFLEENHLQGKINSSANYGLSFNGQIVALMTFGKLRKILGSNSKTNVWEMLRFCCKCNMKIVGAAGKLLNYFVNTHHPEKIVSYADYRWSTGKLYLALGFKKKHLSRPNYWYVKVGTINRLHRAGFQKHKLPSLLKSFDPDKTEIENVLSNGYAMIYDCGNLVFEKDFS